MQLTDMLNSVSYTMPGVYVHVVDSRTQKSTPVYCFLGHFDAQLNSMKSAKNDSTQDQTGDLDCVRLT